MPVAEAGAEETRTMQYFAMGDDDDFDNDTDDNDFDDDGDSDDEDW